VLTVAAGLLRRDHMELTSGPVSWHNEAHNVVSLVLYLDLVVVQLLLARRLGAIPCWRPWRRYLLASGIATAVALAVFLPNTTSPTAGLLQRIAVTIPLAAMTAVAARLGRPATASVPQHARRPAH
jgi:peptidoglycan/LPS O-acetylase OafA/YrhL